MKIIPVCLGSILACLLGICFFFSHPEVLGRFDSGARDSLSSEELKLVREGDIILRSGIGLPSQLISSFFQPDFGISHCAVIVVPKADVLADLPEDRLSFKKDGAFLRQDQFALIHTINENLSGVNGVQIQDLTHFNRYSKAASLVLVRPRMDETQRARFIQAAWKALENRIPFDNQYDQADASQLYCSELLYYLFDQVGWEGSTSKKTQGGIIRFDSFLDSEYFQILLSHNLKVQTSF